MLKKPRKKCIAYRSEHEIKSDKNLRSKTYTNAVFETVKLPASISDLNTSLTDVD
jgi:hypothetical protein